MSFVLIIFTDTQRSGVLKVLKFQKMKDMIKFTNNKVNYYDVRRDYSKLKYNSLPKSIFEVVRI